MKRKVLSLIPFVLILALILIYYLTEGLHFLNFNTIQQEHLKWKAYVAHKPLLSALYFVGIYVISVILVIPDSIFLCLLGGFLFPMPLAIAYASIAETVGATIFFLACRSAFIGTFARKKTFLLYHLLSKIRKDQVYYLLFFRLSHLLPFWVINLGAGLVQVKTRTFFWTTLIGTLPLIFFLVDGAEGLSKYLETHTEFTLRDIFTTQLKIALIGLGALSLLPLLYKKLMKR